MTRNINPRYGVNYGILDSSYPDDKGFAYFNSLEDAERFRDLLIKDEQMNFSVIDFRGRK